MTATTPGVRTTAARTLWSCARSVGVDICAAIVSGPLKPGPNPSDSRLKALYVLVLVGSLPASLVSRRMPKNGTRNASITASERIASGQGRFCTVMLQRRQVDSRGASPLASRRRARRVGRTTRWPNEDSSAGSTVSDAASTSSTATTDAIDSP